MSSAVPKGLISKRKTHMSAFKRERCSSVLSEVGNDIKMALGT